MQLEKLNVVLRPRSLWEAFELGNALVRRHAWAIWKPWLLLTGTLFVILNTLAWWLDAFWLAALLMWWLKPVFELIPLFVLSRSVFGDVPSTKQSLAAPWRWGGAAIWGYVLWRRFGVARSLLMPVDFLERGSARQRRQRRAGLGGSAWMQASLLTSVLIHFEWMLQLAGMALVLMFIPLENWLQSVQAFWVVLRATPVWLQVGLNALAWLSMSIIAPFYSGAGFGLYLNRRMQLEAWDIEIAFRRLQRRLSLLAPLLLLAALPLCYPLSAQAQTPDKFQLKPARPVLTQPEAISLDENRADNQSFAQAVDYAYEDPKLGSFRTITRTKWHWRRDTDRSTPAKELPSLPSYNGSLNFRKTGDALAVVGKGLLWLLLAALIVFLLFKARQWLPRRSGRRNKSALSPSALHNAALKLPEKLPADIIGSARRLWQQGQPRPALALLYRGALNVVAQRARLSLSGSATETDCLQFSQNMPDSKDRELFAQLVGLWQQTAWAGNIPSDHDFSTVLERLGRQYGWRR